MDSTTPDTTISAASQASARRLSPRPPATSLAGLIDVLDRVDGPTGGPGRRRLAAHRSAAPGPAGARSAGLRPNGFRATATRSTPLRSVQPAPMARRPAAAPVVEPGSYWDMSRPPPPAAPIDTAPTPRVGTRRAALIRRAAMWGAGPDGENLTWRTSMAAPVPVRLPLAAAPPEPLAVARREPWLRGLVRRLALWGAGDDGENLAWRAHARPVPVRRLDPPVVLHEMPSTPMVRPAATSPAAALLPTAAPAARRPIGPVLPRVAPVGSIAPADSSSPAPSGRPPPPTGWPQPPEWPPARLSVPSPRERGLARARGDPLSSPSRGSPLRRPGPPTRSARVWSPAASLPAPRPAHAASG